MSCVRATSFNQQNPEYCMLLTLIHQLTQHSCSHSCSFRPTFEYCHNTDMIRQGMQTWLSNRSKVLPQVCSLRQNVVIAYKPIFVKDSYNQPQTIQISQKQNSPNVNSVSRRDYNSGVWCCWPVRWVRAVSRVGLSPQRAPLLHAYTADSSCCRIGKNIPIYPDNRHFVQNWEKSRNLVAYCVIYLLFVSKKLWTTGWFNTATYSLCNVST
jgi:hypothetical protein